MRTLLTTAALSLTLALVPAAGSALAWSGIPDGVSHVQGGGPGGDGDGDGGGDMGSGGGDMGSGGDNEIAMPDDPSFDDGDHHGGDSGNTGSGPAGSILHVCRRGDGRNDKTGLYAHNVSVDAEGLELDDQPTTIPCDKENKIADPNPPLPASFYNADNVQVKQAVSECRNGTWHTITYDLTQSPRKEMSDKPSSTACTA
jgi:hypothetical protein